MIEILSTGLSNTVQDRGRLGYLSAGVSRSGAMDGLALDIANRLLGNPGEAAGLEISIFPFRLRFLKACRFALAGAAAEAVLDGVTLPPFWCTTAADGQELRLSPPKNGARVVIAFAGGLDVPVVLGSRATDLKSGWGGLEGRGLRRGDQLPLLASASPSLHHLPSGFGADVSTLRPLQTRSTTLRVLPGAEWDAFGIEGQNLLQKTGWVLTQDANRQGYRLQGPILQIEKPVELFSHGIMPGTVQVPPSGQPIIQLAEANTCGGYAKIAHVIEADLWRLAQLNPGDSLNFAPVTREEAITALRHQHQELERLTRDVRLITRATTPA